MSANAIANTPQAYLRVTPGSPEVPAAGCPPGGCTATADASVI